MQVILTQRLTPNAEQTPNATLKLTAEERFKSRHRFDVGDFVFFLRLPRGTVLRHNDLLQNMDADYWVRVEAKDEPVLTVSAGQPQALIKAAYHLGNRHVPLEITAHYLRLSPDPVLKAMLMKLDLVVVEELAPFQPEIGAYHTVGLPHVH